MRVSSVRIVCSFYFTFVSWDSKSFQTPARTAIGKTLAPISNDKKMTRFFTSTAVLVSTIFIGLTSCSRDCDCCKDFQLMKDKVEKNYAGFHDKVTDSTKTEYQNLTADIENKIQNTNDFKECTKLMRNWVAFFRDRHLFLSVLDGSEHHESFPPTFKRLDSNFCLLTIPSFDYAYKHKLDSIVTANHSLIVSTPYLIIDLTDNDGGADDTYEILRPYVLSKAVVMDGLEFWTSPDNIKQYEDIANDTNNDKDLRQQCKEVADKMKTKINSYVNVLF